jgi:hypothetical protein
MISTGIKMKRAINVTGKKCENTSQNGNDALEK